jgi:hypothetical protein
MTTRGSDARRMRNIGYALIAIVGSALGVAPSEAGRKECFVPGEYSETNGLVEVDHQSGLCKAFQRELNATCDGPVPTVDFKPWFKDSGLTTPNWKGISLYDSDGSESKSGFAKLKELAYAKAFTTYFGDKESLANRDVTSIMNSVRTAHAAGRRVVFEKASFMFAGAFDSESLYRLFTNGTDNPTNLSDELVIKPEPILFLERAVSLAALKRPIAGGGLAAGRNLTGASADVLLFKGEPFLMTWVNLPRAVLVYSPNVGPAHLESGEVANSQTIIVLYERCVFDFTGHGGS